MRLAIVACVLQIYSAMDARAAAKQRSLARVAEKHRGTLDEPERALDTDRQPSGGSFVEDGSGLGITTEDIGSDNREETTQKIRDYTMEKPASANVQRETQERTCKTKMDTCFSECDNMFFFYIDVVTQKFHGLQFLPLQHTTNPEEVKEKAATPVLNEGAYLFCGLENCYETQCKNVCKDDEMYSDSDNVSSKPPAVVLDDRCRLVEVKKRQYIQQWFAQAHIQLTIPYLTLPVCRSVCGPKESEKFSTLNEVDQWAKNDISEKKNSVASTRFELLLLAIVWTCVNFS